METESFSYKLESRPGQLLIDHLMNTANLCSKIKEMRLSIGGEDEIEILGEIACLIGFTHDLGKATGYFQEYLREDDEARKASLKNKDETHHSLLSSLFTYRTVSDYVIRKYLSNHKLFRYLPILSFLIVKRHHGNPIDMKDEILLLMNQDSAVIKRQLESIDPDEFEHILKKCPYVKIDFAQFRKEIEGLVSKSILKDEKKAWPNYCKKSNLDTYFLFQLLYSALLAADKSDAIGIKWTDARPALPSDLVDQYRAIKFGEPNSKNRIDPIRNEIYDVVSSSINTLDTNSKIFSINVPTGTGKTLTGLSFALKLREKILNKEDFTPKIIYCLPFLSIIEQNFSVFEDIFKTVTGQKPDNRILLKHHHLAEITYRFSEDEELPIDESQFLIEGWKSEIVVTTFMQLFHTMISNRNRMIRKFNSMINAIILLDEVQTVPYNYWHLIRKLFLRFANIFNTRFILMTATQPLIFEKNEIVELIPINKQKKYIENLNRITVINQSHDNLDLDTFKIIVKEDIKKYPDDDLLIVLNTINCSIDVFNGLRSYVNDRNLSNVELYYLSTNIIPKHRLQRIEDIKKSTNRKIIVSTQLIEAGVDIDVDRVYRDFAPLDSLNQVAGRCNRNFSEGKKGTVTLYSLGNGKAFYRYIYGKGDISISKTRDVLYGKKELTEKHFLELGLDYFKRLKSDQSVEKAEHILDQLSKLNFESVCEDKKNGFRLIEAAYPTRDLFIEIDHDATVVWEKYSNARKEKDPFKKKSEINRIKKDFYNYVISVPVNKAPGETIKNTEIVFINKDQMESVYEEHTGFIRKDPTQYVF